MKSLTPQTAAALSMQGAATTICVLMVRPDNAVRALTAHDRPISFDGYTFQPAPGLTLETLELTSDLAPDHGFIETALSLDGLSRDDIEAGRYAGARCEIWRVHSGDPGRRVLLAVGEVGELEIVGDLVRIEVRGRKHRLARPVGRIYQKTCDAQLGDPRCGVDLSAYQSAGTVTSEGPLTLEIALSGGEPPAGFSGGVLTMTDGALAGLSVSIRTERVIPGVRTLTLWEALPRPVVIGTAVTLTPGCDKRFSTCRDIFQNTERFRGFPTIPGTAVLAVAGRAL